MVDNSVSCDSFEQIDTKARRVACGGRRVVDQHSLGGTAVNLELSEGVVNANSVEDIESFRSTVEIDALVPDDNLRIRGGVVRAEGVRKTVQVGSGFVKVNETGTSSASRAVAVLAARCKENRTFAVIWMNFHFADSIDITSNNASVPDRSIFESDCPTCYL